MLHGQQMPGLQGMVYYIRFSVASAIRPRENFSLLEKHWYIKKVPVFKRLAYIHIPTHIVPFFIDFQFQPLPLKQPYRVIWWEFQISLLRSGFLKNKSMYKSNHLIWRMLPNLSWCSHHCFGHNRCSRLNKAILWPDSLSLLKIMQILTDGWLSTYPGIVGQV